MLTPDQRRERDRHSQQAREERGTEHNVTSHAAKAVAPMMVVSASIVNEQDAGNHRGSEMTNVLP